MSEVIPEDEDRGGEDTIGGGTPAPDEPETGLEDEGGTGTDDGGPGSRNM